MKRHISVKGAAVFALLNAVVTMGWAGDAVYQRETSSHSVGLSNLDDADTPQAPVATGASAPEAAAADAKTAKAAKAAPEGPAEGHADAKTAPVDPLTQHRATMLHQVDPEVYMNSNQAVSRRYLMVDKATFQSRVNQ